MVYSLLLHFVTIRLDRKTHGQWIHSNRISFSIKSSKCLNKFVIKKANRFACKSRKEFRKRNNSALHRTPMTDVCLNVIFVQLTSALSWFILQVYKHLSYSNKWQKNSARVFILRKIFCVFPNNFIPLNVTYLWQIHLYIFSW